MNCWLRLSHPRLAQCLHSGAPGVSRVPRLGRRTVARLARCTALAARLTGEVKSDPALRQSTVAASTVVCDALEKVQPRACHNSQLLLRRRRGCKPGKPSGADGRCVCGPPITLWTPSAWTPLALAYTAQGQRLGAIRAEAGGARGADLRFAADRFVRGKDWPGAGWGATDHMEASIIDSRAREVAITV